MTIDVQDYLLFLFAIKLANYFWKFLSYLKPTFIIIKSILIINYYFINFFNQYNEKMIFKF